MAARRTPSPPAQGGGAPPGKSIDPKRLPTVRERPEPAPPHGVPVSPAEYDRLKDRARRAPPLPAGPAQEDSACD